MAGTGRNSKAGGRKPDSLNRATEGRKHVLSVLAKLKAEKGLTLQDISLSLLTCGIPRVVQKEAQILREYRRRREPRR
jgi:hypothetical protein